MKKLQFVELKLNKTIVARERSLKSLKYRLQQLHVGHLVDHPKSTVHTLVTNINKRVGNIFEATL